MPPVFKPQLDRDIRQLSSGHSLAASAEQRARFEDETANDTDDEDLEEESHDEEMGTETETGDMRESQGEAAQSRTAEEGLGGLRRGRPGGLKRVAVPVRVEPKVFFANERTLLSWLRFVSWNLEGLEDLC